MTTGPTTLTKCDRRLGWNTPTRTLVLDCTLDVDHPDPHLARWEHGFPNTPGYTMISWLEDDRRTFLGDFIECPSPGCVLPAGHPRGHAQ